MIDKCNIDTSQPCVVSNRLDEIERRIADLDNRNHKSHERFGSRIDVLEKKENVQDIRYESMIEKMGDLSESMKDLRQDSKTIISQLPELNSRVQILEHISEDVEELKDKPAKQWNKLVETIIGLIIAAVVGFVLANIGL